MNREKVTGQIRDWCERHPDYERNRQMARKFGLSADIYDQLERTQAFVCAICGKRDRARRLAVDHSHATGCVRALLCSRCNLTLGRVEDDPELLVKMAQYLLHHADNPEGDA